METSKVKRRGLSTLFASVFFVFITSSFIPGRETYPVPAGIDNMLFFIQRNLNANAVVYESNFDEEGNLDSEDPITVYWMRYADDGAKKDLGWFEKKLAYGVSTKKINDTEFEVELVAYDGRKFTLKQIAKNKAEVFVTINGISQLVKHVYLEASDGGLMPSVAFIELFGEAEDGTAVYEKFKP